VVPRLASIRGLTPLRCAAAEIPCAAGLGSRYLLVCPAFPVVSLSGLAADDQVIAVVGGLNPMVLRHRASQ